MNFLPLLLSITFCSLAKASDCTNIPWNATGSLTTPGPRYNDSMKEFQWTLSNLIFESTNPGPPYGSNVGRYFEVLTTPFQNFSDPSIPITGCIFMVPTFARSWDKGLHDDGTCSSVLDSGCLAELITTINTTSAAFSGTQMASCNSIQAKLMKMDGENTGSKCASHWSRPPFAYLSAPGDAWLPSPDPTCKTTNVNTANSTEIYKMGWTNLGDVQGNYLAYDAALVIPAPMIVTTWSKPGNTLDWADTKVVCVPGNQTVSNGSRSVSSVTFTLPTETGTSVASTTSSSATPGQSSGAGRSFNAGTYFTFIATIVFGLAM